MKRKIINVLEIIATVCGLILIIAGCALFIKVNSALISLWGVLVAVLVVTSVACFTSLIIFRKKGEGKGIKISSCVGFFIALAFVVGIAITALVIDFFQPLALTTASQGLLFAGFAITLFGALIGIIFNKKKLTALIACAYIISILFTGVVWANAQPYADFYNCDGAVELFVSGESGYKTFRIPSLVVIDKDYLNAQNKTQYENDILLAMAEGRKDASFDIGEIDLVYKLSFDKGNTWSALKILFSVDGVGKVGNPTAIFDEETGYLNIIYLVGTEKNGYNYQTFNARGKFNFSDGFEFEESILLNTEYDVTLGTGKGDGVNRYTLMPGPGKIIKSKGRLIAPCSNDGYSFALMSDDGGKTWKEGNRTIKGNECEIAIVDENTLIMVSRSNINCSGTHNEQYVRIAYSYDNGENWVNLNEETSLKTPICMSSVCSYDGGIVIAYQDDFFTRADLTVAFSFDKGKTITTKKLYDGASGYACVNTDGEDLYIVAEIGKVNYNEIIVFVKYGG